MDPYASHTSDDSPSEPNLNELQALRRSDTAPLGAAPAAELAAAPLWPAIESLWLMEETLFHFLRALGLSSEESRDGVQETFCIAFRQWGKTALDKDWKRFVYGVARNIALRVKRKEARERERVARRQKEQTGPVGEGVDPGGTPEGACLLKELEEVVWKALYGLTEIQRVCLDLEVGRSVEDLARELGIAVGTVKTHRSKARAKLAQNPILRQLAAA